MNELYRRIATGTGLAFAALSLFILPYWAFTLVIVVILMRVLIIEWPRLFSPSEYLFWILAPLYPILPACLIISLQWSGYAMLNLLLFSLVSAHDAGAYFVGKTWGKTVAFPHISPHKTWEGFLGGLICSSLFSLIFFGHNSLRTLIGKIFPFLICINLAALVGDLFESALKRRVGRKDAGTMLPGHGGVLDRVDGILFAVGLIFLSRRWLIALLPH